MDAPQSVSLEAFRDLTYPLGVGSYDAYAIPRHGFITKVDRSGDRLTLTGDIEIVEKFQRSYKLVRTPLRSVPATVLSRDARMSLRGHRRRWACRDRRHRSFRRRRQFPNRPHGPLVARALYPFCTHSR